MFNFYGRLSLIQANLQWSNESFQCLDPVLALKRVPY